MKIREGAYYRTRDGRTIGPATPNHDSRYPWNIPHNGGFLLYYRDDGTICADNRDWDIVAEVPTPWRDMTPEQRGALLLAHHEGRVVETLFGDKWTAVEPEWCDDAAYRVAPKRETVTLYAQQPSNAWDWVPSFSVEKTHRITFDLLDGEPDCTSIKMEKL